MMHNLLRSDERLSSTKGSNKRRIVGFRSGVSSATVSWRDLQWMGDRVKVPGHIAKAPY
jgi:hypothetical protein